MWREDRFSSVLSVGLAPVGDTTARYQRANPRLDLRRARPTNIASIKRNRNHAHDFSPDVVLNVTEFIPTPGFNSSASKQDE